MSEPDQVARKLPEGARSLMRCARDRSVYAGSGFGHSIEALRRRALVVGEPFWDTDVFQWAVRLTDLGKLVAQEVQAEDRDQTKPRGLSC